MKGTVRIMTDRNKLPPQKDSTPLLDEAERRAFESSKRERLNRWYRLYLSTTITALFLTVAFLVVGISERADIPRPKLDSLASFFLWSDLMDLSAEKNESDTPPDPSQDGIFDIQNGIMIPSKDPDDQDSVIVPNTPPSDTTGGDIYSFDYSKVPEGETPIVPMDLSLSSYGATYIHNTTGYSPDTKALLEASLKKADSPTYISSTSKPLVLIVHTHGTEAYSKDGAISYLDTGGEIARSENTSKNVVSIGALMADIFNKNGIPTLHCSIMHDQLQYKDSYARAEATIKQYLEKYPSIKLVIDLHRDSILKSSGELVRPVASVNSRPAAQVMCVVGSDWGGEACPSWERNLSLALKLRDSLNAKYGNLCRPTYLRPSTYNQELAPYSLLLEMGASGNSLEEAKYSAELVAQELIPLIKMM